MPIISITQAIENLNKNIDLEEGYPINRITDRNIIFRLQYQLTHAGYFIASDGIMGEQTYNAWRQFKIENQLPYPDLLTKYNLELLATKTHPRFQKHYLDNQSLDTSWKIYYEPTTIRRIFLDLIAWCCKTDQCISTERLGYEFLANFKTLADFAKDYRYHPNVKVETGGLTSSAAGRYQIFQHDWALINRAIHLPSFEPVYQDQAALWLIHMKCKALSFVDNLDLWNFCQACSYQWPYLPPQRFWLWGKEYEAVKEIFEQRLKMYGIEA